MAVIPPPVYWRCQLHDQRGRLDDQSLRMHEATCHNGNTITVKWEPEDGPTLGPMPLDKQTATELSRAASIVRTWTEKRNELIRSARAAGGGLREIARATGLNEATVHNIITPRSRGGT